MKKSQLRKIIRESIKQLMTEQTGPPYSNFFNIARSITFKRCDNTYSVNGVPGYDAQGNIINYSGNTVVNGDYGYDSTGGCANDYIGSVTVNGTTPQVGQIIDASGYSVLWPAMIAKIIAVGPPCDPSTITSSFPFSEPDFSLATQAQIQAIGNNAICQSITQPPQPLVAGCTVVQSPNYDATADGCEVNGVVDINDVTCCAPVQPGGGITPTNVGPPMATQGKQLTPTPPDSSDPQMKRMKNLAFKGKK